MMFRHFRFFLFALISINAKAGTLPAYPFIHVNGSATITLPANIAEMDFELTSFEASADETLTLLNAQSSEMLESLSGHQIVAGDIEAHDTRKLVSANEMQTNDQRQQRHRLIRTFHIYVRNLENWNVLTQYLLSRPFLGNFSVRFGRTDYAQIEHQLTSKAAGNAKDRAKELAAGFSVKLMGPMAISEQALSRIGSELGLDGARLVQNNAGSSVNAGDKPTMSDLSLPAALMYKKSVNAIFRTK